MNRLLHKTIFNKSTGLMAVVAENACNNGKSRKDKRFQVALFRLSGSLKDDTAIMAGKHYQQISSTVSSPEGNNTIHAQSIDIQAAHNQLNSNTTQTYEQKGLTVAFSSPVTDLAQQAIAVAQSSKQVGQSKNGRVNAMAAANAGWQAYQTGKRAQNLANGTTNANQVSISITYGEQKNQQTTQIQASQAQASQIQAGGKTTLIATGAAEPSNITLTGSDVAGKAGTTLIIDNDITLQSTEQSNTERSNNKSSGWNAGIKVAYENGKPVLGITAGGNVGKGYGNGDSITHRHSHIGDSSSLTTIQSGSDTTIKGAQVHGKGVQVNAQNLSIQSVQDSETYQSKQQNASAQITVGYGASASGNYSQSKINADYASVNEQSGIFAGEDGYQINIKNHTDLKGGIITSTQSAEDKGKNQFSTGTLAHRDIQNHSRYEGESFGLGASIAVSGKTLGQGEQNNPQESHLTTVADKNGTSSSIGYGNDSDSQSSVTRSGINTQNISITDEDKQIQLMGKTAEESKAQIHTNLTTDTANQHSDSLNNNFDADRVQSEIDLQVEVTQEFSRNLQDLNHRQNQRKDDLKAQLERNEITQQYYNEQVAIIERQNLMVNMIAGGLMSPSDSALGIATSAVSPAVSFQVGQHFKKEGKEGSFEHIATHAVIGALTSVANGGNALSGAVSAGGAEYIAKVTAETLFKKDAKDLTADEKQTVSSISQIVSILSGSLTGDSSANAYIGGNVATNAVENNAINGLDGFTPDERIQNKFLSSCMKSSSKQECQRRLNEKEWENTKKIISTVADFVPIIGDIKGFAEAETKGDYFFATLAVIPIFGEGAKKVHDAHKAYEAAKAVKDVEKMKEAMQVASMQIKLPIPVTAQQKRNSAGTSFSSTSLVELKIGESLFKGNNYAPVPKQIADKLSVKHFNSFDEFRQEFWKLMADDPAVAKNFNSSNLKRMKQGYAPFAPKNQHNGQNKKYELDHNIEIRDGGSVYNLDNIIIRTPLDHANKTRNRKQ